MNIIRITAPIRTNVPKVVFFVSSEVYFWDNINRFLSILGDKISILPKFYHFTSQDENISFDNIPIPLNQF